MKNKSLKKMAQFFLTLFALAITLNVVTPVVAYAANNDPSGVDIKIQDNGSLSASGGGFGDGSTTGSQAWNDLIGKYKNFITGIAGIGAVTMIVFFIINFLKLGATTGNAKARNEALIGCLWTGIAAAGLGAVTIFVGFFYHAVG